MADTEDDRLDLVTFSRLTTAEKLAALNDLRERCHARLNELKQYVPQLENIRDRDFRAVRGYAIGALLSAALATLVGITSLLPHLYDFSLSKEIDVSLDAVSIALGVSTLAFSYFGLRHRTALERTEAATLHMAIEDCLANFEWRLRLMPSDQTAAVEASDAESYARSVILLWQQIREATGGYLRRISELSRQRLASPE